MSLRLYFLYLNYTSLDLQNSLNIFLLVSNDYKMIGSFTNVSVERCGTDYFGCSMYLFFPLNSETYFFRN